MKFNFFFFITILSVCSLECFSQETESASINSEPEFTQEDNSPVLYYHVEEKINSRSGGSITTYNVTNLKNIKVKDLGSNNSRKIIAKYSNGDSKLVIVPFSTNKLQNRAKTNNSIPLEKSKTLVIPKSETTLVSVQKTEKNKISSDNQTQSNSKKIVAIERNIQSNQAIKEKFIKKEDIVSNIKKEFVTNKPLVENNNKISTRIANIEQVKSVSISKSIEQNLKGIENKIIATEDNISDANQMEKKSKITTSPSLDTAIFNSTKNAEITNKQSSESTQEINPTDTSKKYVTVDVIGAYERILEKGYISKDLFIKVGNSNYFKGNFESAVKWYSKLFDLKTDLESVFYTRFSQSLVAINDTEKSNQIMKLLDKKAKKK